MKNQKKTAKESALRIILYSCLGVLAVSALSLFVFYNKRSREAIQAERDAYTTEIVTQMTRNLQNIQDSYVTELTEGANVLEVSKPTKLTDLSTLYPDRPSAKHYIVSSKGKIYDTANGIHVIDDTSFLPNLYESDGSRVLMSHTRLDMEDAYLLFGKKIDPVTIDGSDYYALLIGVTSEQLSENMVISLFDGVGSGYLITEEGVVFLRPNNDQFAGISYNFFTILSKGGVSDEDIAALRTNMKTGKTEANLKVNGTEWMIEIQATQFSNDYIVVAVPLSLTAGQTFLNMTLTVAFAFVFIIALAAIMIIVMFDGLLRKRDEDRKAAAVEAQTSFLAKMSHDIRTPLNAVNGMLELASDPRHSRAEVDEFVGKASESANYLLELINGMLDLQKINSGKMSVARDPFSMSSLLDAIASMYTPVLENKGLVFVITGEKDFDSDYYGDATKVKEILMNLLSNAMKFTPKGGTVSLLASRKKVDETHDSVELIVRDSGIGMSEEFQSHMFRPFEQEKSSASSTYVGTGLGLSIVKNLSELLGGGVRVESSLGKGSSFFVTLPFEKTGSIQPAVVRGNNLVPFAHQKILLAEDNPINQQIVILLLKERLSLEVVAVNNGQEAVTRYLASKPGEFSAILMDLRMPVMNGLEAAKTIRASNHPEAKNIPIIALSANTYAEDIKQSLEAGMNAHLAKPIDLNELADTLHQYIH
jgi:signal transduction histidine kinase/CheY-like chemotaxis protein